MTVSVAMATFNGINGIERQVESVLCQLRPTDELVISDDGSTDGTAEFLRDLAAKDARVRLLCGPKAGLVKNFEHALSACKGDWIFLCDQDDLWDEDKRQTVMDTAKATDAILVMHDARVTDREEQVIEPSFFAVRNTRTGFLKNLWKNSYIGCCMAFSNRLLSFVLPFPDGIPMHDQWIGMQAERHGRVALIDRPLLTYRRHGGNASPSSHGTVAAMVKGRLGMMKALLSRH